MIRRFKIFLLIGSGLNKKDMEIYNYLLNIKDKLKSYRCSILEGVSDFYMFNDIIIYEYNIFKEKIIVNNFIFGDSGLTFEESIFLSDLIFGKKCDVYFTDSVKNNRWNGFRRWYNKNIT